MNTAPVALTAREALYPQAPITKPGIDATVLLAPSAPALGEMLQIQRAFRPLKRWVPSRRLEVLDEDATASQIADQLAQHRHWSPVMQPSLERWLDLALVVDTSPSMTLWRPLVHDLLGALIQLGAFRDVRVWHLIENGDELSIAHTSAGAPTRSVTELVNPSGRQVVLVLSDCTGRSWWRGSAGQALYRWGQHGPVAILQPLPERMWCRTAASTTPALARVTAPCAPNAGLRFTPFDDSEEHAPGSLPVPVMEVSAPWIAAWARLTAGLANEDMLLAVTYIDGSDNDFSPDTTITGLLSARERVLRFRSVASPDAFRLAAYLATTSPILPVIRLVQQAMLGPPRPAVLAEVILSGLLRAVDADKGYYEFLPGVRDVLLGSLSKSEAWRAIHVLQRVSAELEARSGADANLFRALRAVGRGLGELTLDPGTPPFALASPEALRKLVASNVSTIPQPNLIVKAPPAAPNVEDATPPAGRRFPLRIRPRTKLSAEADFFISYAGADRLWAEWIAWQLEAEGYSARNQAWDFAPGSDFVHEMHKAVTDAERTIVVLSPDYLTSAFGEAEWRAVFAKDPTGARRLLVPVRVRDCQPPGLLATRVWIDLTDADEHTAKDRLLRGIRKRGARPTQSPRFPRSGPGSVGEVWRYPGGLPPIFEIPYQPHPSFIGREDLLATIHRGFANSRGTHRQVLTGMGGAGKTQLAVEYAYRYQGDYDLVWWIRAGDKSTLIADYTALGVRVGLPARSDQDAAVAEVQEWLLRETHQRWLLILDGIQGPQIAQALLPNGGEGHVLLTSRHERAWEGIADVVAVDLLPPSDATDLLLARTGQTDRVAAKALAGELGYLPLALEQAAGLITQTGVVTLEQYLGLFRERSRELLGKGQPEGAAQTVATTWNLSLERLQQESPAAVELLTLAAFLAPEQLPWRLLTDHVAIFPPTLAKAAGDVLELGKAVIALRRYSLARVAGRDGLIVHRLLQTVIREQLGEAKQREWSTVAVRLVERSFPPDPIEPPAWSACQRLLPHAVQAVLYAETLGVEPEHNTKIIERAVDYLAARGQLEEANVIMQWLLRLTTTVSRQGRSGTAAIHRSLGRVLRDLGKPSEARMHLERALTMDEAIFGPNSGLAAEDCRHLGRVLRELGDLAGARAQLERALEIDLARFHPNHPQVAKDRHSLGRVLQNLGDLLGARFQMEQALAINEAAFGADHWRTAYVRCQLATILRDLGELPQARGLLEHALAIDERTFGAEHWRAGQDRRYLGTVLRDLGDLHGARAELERAIQIDGAVYDPEHWQVAQDRRYLGTVLRGLGDIHGARTQLELALRIDESTYGPGHWRTAQDHRHLGRVLAHLGDLPAARAHLEQALTIDQATYGSTDWRIAEDSRYYSLVLRKLGDLAGARAQLERALGIDEQTFGPVHWRTAQDRRYLGRVLLDMGDLDGARDQLQRALEIVEQLQDAHHPVLSAVRRDLERLRQELDRLLPPPVS